MKRRNSESVIPTDPGALLDYSQAGALLAIGRTTLSKLVKNGEIPTVQINSCVRFRRSALLDWVQKLETSKQKP